MKKRFGVIAEYETDEQFKESKTCLERWVSELNRIETCEKYQEYETMLSFLLLTQHKNFLLVKYGRYNDIYGQDNRTIEDFWNCYDGFYRECRSVVIDLEKECIVLAPFAKFFNINELEETNLENVQKRISKAKYDKYTFIFEYISLKDAHVVKYTEEQEGLYLIGIRNAERTIFIRNIRFRIILFKNR